MSGAVAKATRRELRRAMGDNGVNAVAELQKNVSQLANSLTNAHARIDRLESELRNAREAERRFFAGCGQGR